MASPRTRPLGVTIVAIFVLASGVIATIGAVISLIGGATVLNIIQLILGVLTLAVSAALFAHSQIARIVTAIVLGLEVVSSIWGLAADSATGLSVAAAWPIISGVLAIAAIILLFTRKANAYFR